MGFLRQLKALISKNVILKTRLWKQTIWEFIAPIVICFFFGYFQNPNDIKTEQGTTLVLITMGIAIPICFSSAARFVLSQVVVEKESKMKETLRILSLKTGAYGLSFFFTQLIFSLFTAILVTLTFSVIGYIQAGMIFPYFLALLLYAMAFIMYTLFVTTFFSDSKLATQIGQLALILPMAIFIAIYQNDQTLLPIFYWLPHFPMTVILSSCANVTIDTNLTAAWICLVLNIPLHYLLYLYLDQVMPDTYGISKSCCFCLRRRRAQNQQVYSSLVNQDDESRDNLPLFNGDAPIQIKNLTKKFGTFKAVDDLSLDIQQNEVFTLLGHNGAGKTTAIYMMTGVLKPTSGDARIYGNSLMQDMDGVRQSLGLCQQFDVLFDNLTCIEHLKLVCELKDIPANQIQQQINETISVVMLEEHKNKLTNTLSGGMKRKLSLGMALIGGSKLIILDEPTSGLDVESRRQVWNLIRVIKQGRSIIMSTQHLEEADELADRICIMSHGKLLALDTPFNIKKRFGVGYNLLIEPKGPQFSEEFANSKRGFDEVILESQIITGSEESSDSTGRKLIYLIPFDQQSKIPDLLNELERRFPYVYIDIEMNSLEDAYVSIAKAEERLHNQDGTLDKDDLSNNQEFLNYLDIQGSPSFFQQVFAVFKRRMIQFGREPRMWLLLCTPFISSIFSFLIFNGFIPKDQSEDVKRIFLIIVGFLFTLWMLIGFCICSGIFILSPCQDRELKLRYLMNFMGIRSTSYYLGNYLADLCLFLIPCLAFVALLFPMKIHAFTENWDIFLMVLVSFGTALVSLTYVVGFMFANSNSAFRQIGILYMVIGYIVPSTVGSVLSAFTGLDGSKVIRYILVVDPFQPFYEALVYIVLKYTFESNGFKNWEDFNQYFVYTPGIASICMVIMALVFFVIAIIIDSVKLNGFQKADQRQPSWNPRYLPPDSDVIQEAQTVEMDQGQNNYLVKVRNLNKVYDNGYPAVSGNSFGIKQNQVLGLLGPNGAGKSTTFSMLTMEIPRSYGEVYLLQTPIQNFNTNLDGNRMGLCAQNNLIWDKLTVDEHLNFIGSIKGLSKQEINTQRELIKATLDLTPFAKIRASDLSGGNKRKLCCGMSLMANPQVEFLDEPTTGVDPIARRSLFKMLKHLKKSSIMLTTHRMDEAEQLCDVIAIMINGKFVCFGSPGHLKQKYGQGYQITVRTNPQSNNAEVESKVLQKLPFLIKQLQQENNPANPEQGTEIIFKVDVNNFGNDNQVQQLILIFSALNELLSAEVFADYQVTRSSLEHVFIHFAKFQLAQQNTVPAGQGGIGQQQQQQIPYYAQQQQFQQQQYPIQMQQLQQPGQMQMMQYPPQQQQQLMHAQQPVFYNQQQQPIPQQQFIQQQPQQVFYDPALMQQQQQQQQQQQLSITSQQQAMFQQPPPPVMQQQKQIDDEVDHVDVNNKPENNHNFYDQNAAMQKDDPIRKSIQ